MKILSVSLLSLTLAVLLVPFGVSFAASSDGNLIRIGVLAKQGNDACVIKWRSLTDYLSEATGRKVQLRPLPFAEVSTAIKGGEVDFFLTNPLNGIEVTDEFGGSPIASVISLRDGKELNQFAGVIIVRADSDLHELKDLKGKALGCVKKGAFGGYKMQKRLLLENGVNPDVDCKLVKECKTHDKVVEYVMKGLLQAGTIRTDTLESLVAKGKLKMKDIRVLNQIDDDFPFAHSTELYPEWPVVKVSHVDDETAALMAGALIALKADHKAAKDAKIAGFSEPLSYEPVSKLIEVLEDADRKLAKPSAK